MVDIFCDAEEEKILVCGLEEELTVARQNVFIVMLWTGEEV